VKFRKSTPTLEIGKKYSELIDRESAYELLNKKIAQTEAEVAQKNKIKQKKKKLLKQLTPPLNKVLAGSCWEICFKSTYKRHLY
jgi:negative regulator of sigma E activity